MIIFMLNLILVCSSFINAAKDIIILYIYWAKLYRGAIKIKKSLKLRLLAEQAGGGGGGGGGGVVNHSLNSEIKKNIEVQTIFTLRRGGLSQKYWLNF